MKKTFIAEQLPDNFPKRNSTNGRFIQGKKVSSKPPLPKIDPDILQMCRNKGKTPYGVEYETLMLKLLEYGAMNSKPSVDQKKALQLFFDKKMYSPVKTIIFP